MIKSLLNKYTFRLHNGLLLLLICVSLVPLSSCKKGEEDPFISFRSRTNRLCGQWDLVKAVGQINILRADGEEVDYQYYHDDEVNRSYRYKKVTNKSYGYYINFESYDYYFTINEDFTTESFLSAKGLSMNHTSVIDGIWRWIDGEKKKDHVFFSDLNIVYDDLIDRISFGGWSSLSFDIEKEYIESLRTFRVVGLSDKQLILELSESKGIDYIDVESSMSTSIEFIFNKDDD